MTESEPKWFLKKLIQRFLTNAILMKRIIVKKLVLKRAFWLQPARQNANFKKDHERQKYFLNDK